MKPKENESTYQKELNSILKEEKLTNIEIEVDNEKVNDEDKKKSKRLLLLRKSRKMSRRALAEETKISESTIKKYETGKMVAQGGTLATIAKYFGLPLSYFEDPNDILDTDLKLISSLRFYSWLLSTKSNHLSKAFSDGADIDENPRLYSKETILSSVITATQIAIKCLPDTDDNIGACYYIASCLSLKEFDNDLQRDINNGNPVTKLKKYYIGKLNEYSNKINLDHEIPRNISIDNLFRIIEFLVCNRRVVKKPPFNQLIQNLKPLLEIYKMYLQRKSEEYM